MATQTTTSNDKTQKPGPGKAADTTVLLPPEEKFWQRYSAHQELPLSGVSSFTLHFLGIGLLFLMGLGIIKLGSKEQLPVEAIQLAGGGGSKDGEGTEKGLGPNASPVEDKPAEDKSANNPVEPKSLELDPAKALEAKVDFDNEVARYVKAGDEAKAALSRLDQDSQKKLRDGLRSGKGRGGPGSGGGKDGGQGPGEGDSRGPGKQKTSLNQREKRMLRWSMTFNTGFRGTDYVNQLDGLGAILAVPTGPGNPAPGYYVIRNLKQRPVELKEEDLAQIQCIFWVDDRPESVRSLLGALGLKLDVSHVVAFMPPKVEELLFRLERDYAKGLSEDDIDETKFVVEKRAGRFQPRVVSLTRKR